MAARTRKYQDKASWSVPEFAGAVGISPQSVRDLIDAGRLRAVRLNPDLERRSKYLITTTPREFLDACVPA